MFIAIGPTELVAFALDFSYFPKNERRPLLEWITKGTFSLYLEAIKPTIVIRGIGVLEIKLRIGY
jgi:hypothetical protein